MKYVNYMNQSNIDTIHSFFSTTIYLPSAESFMDDQCCLLECILTPYTPCLFIAPVSKEPGEYEILINNSCHIAVNNITIKKILDIPNISMNTLFNIISNYNFSEKKVIECIITI